MDIFIPALTASEKAIELDPNNVSAWVNKAPTLGKLGRLEESLVASEKALELDPNNKSALANKRLALNKLGKQERQF